MNRKLVEVVMILIKKTNNRTIVMAASLLCCLPIVGCGSNNDKKPEETKKMQNDTKTNNLVTRASGLQYQILKAAPADAALPKSGKVVTVHYTGWLYAPEKADQKGTKFDSSVDRGQKFQFVLGVGHVIKGWDEGVADMKVGEKRLLIIPPQLGYGARGAGKIIPGNATLVFEVELFEVQN